MVLPWVPAMATQLLSRISSASISARRTTGNRSARAATSSGLSDLMAEETTTTSASARLVGSLTDGDFHALLAQSFDVGVLGLIGALHPVAEIDHDLSDAAHADAADTDEMYRADVERQFHENSQVPIPKFASARASRIRIRSLVKLNGGFRI